MKFNFDAIQKKLDKQTTEQLIALYNNRQQCLGRTSGEVAETEMIGNEILKRCPKAHINLEGELTFKK